VITATSNSAHSRASVVGQNLRVASAAATASSEMSCT